MISRNRAKLSWGDLLVLAGNVALESMGFTSYGSAVGRANDWEPDLAYWGSEKEFMDGVERYTGDRKLHKSLGASQRSLIYVNAQGLRQL